MNVNSQNGVPLLLLPGLLCDARIWSAQVEGLSNRTVVAIDGYGMADTIEAMATHALERAPGAFIAVGHSMGARVALEIFRNAPDRVAALALIDTGIHLPRPGEAESRHALLTLGRTQGIDALLDRWLPPMVLDSRRNDPSLMEPLRAMCRAGGVDLYATQMKALLYRPEVESLLPTISCPTFIGVGRQDMWSPIAQHEEMAKVIPNSRLAIFDDCGHMSPAEAPDQLNASLQRWLIDLPKSPANLTRRA